MVFKQECPNLWSFFQKLLILQTFNTLQLSEVLMRTLLGKFVGLVALISLSCVIASGQAPTGSISLTVRDQTGAPVPGATVTLTPKPNGLAAGGTANATTDEKGKADIVNIAPGEYRLEAKYTGFRNGFVSVNVFSEFVQKVELFLDAGLSTAVIVIVDQNKRPDGVITSESDEPLPSDPSFKSLLDTSHFVRVEDLTGGVSNDGSTGADNTYFIDGQEVTNPITGVLNTNHNLPLTLLQEVRVKSGAATAENNGSIGGVVSVITRGGNNEWRGDFGISFAPRGLNGSFRPVLNRFGAGTGQVEYFQPNKDKSNAYFPHGSISGPVLKDKLWFFGSYSPQIFQNRRTIDYFNTNAPGRTVTQSIDYKQTVRSEFAYLRLDAQPLKTLKGNISYLWNPIVQDGTLPSIVEGLGGSPQFGGSLSGAALLATRGGRSNANMVNGSVTWTPNRLLFVNLRAGYNFLNEKLNSYGGRNETRYLCSTAGQPQNFPGSNCSPGFNTGDNYVSKFDVKKRTSLAADGGLTGVNAFGRHQIRFGYQYDRVASEVDEGYADTGYVVLYYGLPISSLIGLTPTPGNLGSGFLQRFGVVADVKGYNQAVYGQDTWSMGDRVEVLIGARLENEDVPDYGLPDKIKFGWNDKISPRVGVAIDPLGNGKTRIDAGYFWNFDRLKFNFSQGLGANVFSRDYFEILPSRGVAYNSYTYTNILGGDTSYTPQCPFANPVGYSVCRFTFTPFIGIPPFPPDPDIDPNLKPTRQETFTVGLSQDLGNGFEVQGRYIHKELKNVVEDVGYFNEQGSENYILANPGQGLICTVTIAAGNKCPKAERKYDAVEIALDKRSGNYFFNTSYTWSRLFGSYSGLSSSDELGRSAPNSTRSFDLPHLGFTANGAADNDLLPGDRPHVFKANGGYSHRWASDQITSASAFTTVQSGTPLTTFYSLYNVQTSILFGRGDLGRTERFTETDLRVSHKFGIGSDRRYLIELSSDILNLFDEQNELGRQTSISVTNFTAATLTAAGCTTCSGQPGVFYTIFNNGGIQQYIQNYLNTNGTSNSGLRNDYNLPNQFQQPRSVRFGVRVTF